MATLFSSAQSATRLPAMRASLSEQVMWHDEQTIVAREYEADVHQHVNNCVYGDWLYEGFHATLRAADQPAAAVRPRYLTLEYLRQVRPGDQVRIVTSIHPDGSRRLRADQTLLDAATGEMILRGQTRYLVAGGLNALAGIASK